MNFDTSVVGPNGAAPISYNRVTNTCTLTCHSVAHSASGTGAASVAVKANATKVK